MSEVSFMSWDRPARWDCPGSGSSGTAVQSGDKKSVHHFTAAVNGGDTKIVLTPGCASADQKSGAITLTVHTASANASASAAGGGGGVTHHHTCVWFKDSQRCNCGAVGNACAGANGTIVLRLESAPAKPPRTTEELTDWMNAQFYDLQRYTAHSYSQTRDFTKRLYNTTCASGRCWD